MTLLNISSWWQSLSGFEQIFWAIALLFSLLFIVQTIMSFAGGDGDDSMGDSDLSVEGDHGAGHGYFTIKNFIAFFTIFGWTGVALSKGNVNKGLTIVIALIAGLTVVAIMVFLFASMNKLKQSGTLQMKNALGVIAETYLFIPAKRAGFGKVHIKIQGSLHELQAITDDEEQIPTGKLVKVIDIVNDSVLLVSSKL